MAALPPFVHKSREDSPRHPPDTESLPALAADFVFHEARLRVAHITGIGSPW